MAPKNIAAVSILLPAGILLLSVGRLGQYLSQNASGVIAGYSAWLGGGFKDSADNATIFDCTHNYSISIMSFDPVALYLENFIKDGEIEHLLDVTKDEFDDSRVYRQGQNVLDKSYRVSQSAVVGLDDPVGQCLLQRFRALMGNIQHEDTEKLHLVKYGPGGYFNVHNDWLPQPLEARAPDGSVRLTNRAGSVFAYLDDSCTGGETYFPDLEGVSQDADGSKFSIASTGKGLVVKPRRGNAIFWINAHMNGTGDERLSHASLPVTSGTKIGLNMFSIYYLDSPLVGFVGE